jgi:hypothetical protein
LNDHLEQIEWVKKELDKERKKYNDLKKNGKVQIIAKEEKMRLKTIHQLGELLQLNNNITPKFIRTTELLRKLLNEEGWK